MMAFKIVSTLICIDLSLKYRAHPPFPHVKGENVPPCRVQQTIVGIILELNKPVFTPYGGKAWPYFKFNKFKHLAYAPRTNHIREHLEMLG